MSETAVAEALAALRGEYERRYGFVVFDVRLSEDALEGEVLLPAQRDDAVKRAGEALGREVKDRVRVLSDPATEPLAWVEPVGARADVLRHPRDQGPPPARWDMDAATGLHLSTQMLASDPPARLLARRGDWVLVQMWDGTLGWAHAEAVRDMAPPARHPWSSARRAEAGGTVRVEVPVSALLEKAQALVGVPYVLGGAHPEECLDCSGLVQRLYWDVAGLLLPKHTGDQRRLGIRVPRAEVMPGDLLFFKSRDRDLSHVAMALDDGGERLVHASLRHGSVVVQSFEQVRGSYAFLGARRVARFVDAPLAVSVGAAVSAIDLSNPRTLIGHNVHVVGVAGAEGAAIVRFLAQQGVTSLTVHDFSTPDGFEKSFRLAHVGLKPRERSERLREILSLPIRRCFREEYLSGIEEAEVVFLPQGWFLYDSNAPIRELRKRGDVVFSHMTDLYFRLAPCPVAAVTGTNGKSTTSRLLADMVEAAEIPLLFGGNERRSVQFLHRLEGFPRDGRMVLEVSNRQLMDLEPRPHVAVVTNVTPDHIEEHGSFEAYQAAKFKLVAGQGPEDFAVLNHDNEICRGFAARVLSRVMPFSLSSGEGDGAWLRDGRLVLRRDGAEVVVCDASELRVPGRHNVANVLAASMAAWLCGVPPEVIRRTARSFQGIGLRLQPVGEIDGVRYFNDIKATTPEAATAAVESFEAPMVVIVGGGDKGLDYARFASAVAARAKHLLVLESAGGERVAAAVAAVGGPRIHRFQDLESAVAACPELVSPGDVVLLSPACPGLFSMYMDEGKGFGALVRELGARISD